MLCSQVRALCLFHPALSHCLAGFLLYLLTVLIFSLVMIYGVSPKYGRTTPLIYISICSLVGSVSIMAIKGFGVALKLTFNGNNQLTHPSTYVFGILIVVCIMVQMNYFNKALDTFSTNVYVLCFVLPLSCAWILTNPQRQPNVLRWFLNRNARCIPHSLPRVEHLRRNCNRLSPFRVRRNLPRRAPPQHLPCA